MQLIDWFPSKDVLHNRNVEIVPPYHSILVQLNHSQTSRSTSLCVPAYLILPFLSAYNSAFIRSSSRHQLKVFDVKLVPLTALKSLFHFLSTSHETSP